MTQLSAVINKTNGRIALVSAITALATVLYFPVLKGLAEQWLQDANYRYGFLVPAFSALLLYHRRQRLASAEPGGGILVGALLIAMSAAFIVGGTASNEPFISRLSLPTFLLGLSFFMWGTEYTRIAAFPLLFLFMMIPLPYILFYKIAFPLQMLSAGLSSSFLDSMGVTVICHGNTLHLPNYSLEIVPACSGIRSLTTLLILAIVIMPFSDVPLLKKCIVISLAVPAAILANTFRISLTALGAYMVGPSFADGMLHGPSGLLVLFTGLAVLAAVCLILRRLQWL